MTVKDRGSVANGFVTLQWRWSAGSVLVMKRIQTGLNDTCCVCLLYLSLDSYPDWFYSGPMKLAIHK